MLLDLITLIIHAGRNQLWSSSPWMFSILLLAALS
jgi:hypothetical protein